MENGGGVCLFCFYLLLLARFPVPATVSALARNYAQTRTNLSFHSNPSESIAAQESVIVFSLSSKHRAGVMNWEVWSLVASMESIIKTLFSGLWR